MPEVHTSAYGELRWKAPEAGGLEPMDLASLHECAQMALRGVEVPPPFSWIPHEPMRRRLASELMLSADPMGEGWIVMFAASCAEHRPIVANALTRILRTSPKPDCRDSEAPLPACIAGYEQVRDPNQAGFRRRALATFEALVHFTILLAHGEGPRSRTEAAWAVLDAIDSGSSLMRPLRECFGVGKSAIRAGCFLDAESWIAAGSWRRLRRMLMAVAQVPAPLRPERIHAGDGYATDLELAAVIAARAHLPLRKLLPLPAGACRRVTETSRLAPSLQRAELRCQIRRLRTKGLARWKQGFIDDSSQTWTCAARAVETTSGWSATPLYKRSELVAEGTEMRNCAAELGKSVLNGTVAVFSLRSGEPAQRFTLVIEDVASAEDSDLADNRSLLYQPRPGGEVSPARHDIRATGHSPHTAALHVRIAGPDNDLPTPAGIRGAMEVVETIWPGVRIALIDTQ